MTVSVDRILASPTGRRAAVAMADSVGDLVNHPHYLYLLGAALAVLISADEKCETCGGEGMIGNGYAELNPQGETRVPCQDCGGTDDTAGSGSNPAKLYTAEQVAQLQAEAKSTLDLEFEARIAQEREDARAEAVADLRENGSAAATWSADLLERRERERHGR